MNYAKINLFDIANGEGIRVSLFLSGCKFKCPGCFNQQLWDYNYGKVYSQETEEIILTRLKDSRFDGLSILGGDPLWQTDEGILTLISLCKKVHNLGKNVWIWSGYTWEDLVKLNDKKIELVKNTDIFIDGQFNEKLKDVTLSWRGSSNQRIIDIKKTIKNNAVVTVTE